MDTDLSGLWDSRSKPQPPSDAEAHFGKGIIASSASLALRPLEPFIFFIETILIFRYPKQNHPHPGPGFHKKVKELMLPLKGRV